MNRQRGFTLIEVVVAFVLLAAVLGVGFQIFSTGLARASQLEERSRALAIAQSQLGAAGVEDTLKEGETRGESEDRRYAWTTTITKSMDGVDSGKPAPSAYSLFRIDVVVTWTGSNGRPQALPLSTLGIWTTNPS
ncbi:MAG TPA: type II secretion system protein [Usitatibacter sp.]|jgi:general secretion pathway protein I|nr:type II secretion system protein [Usitatibacter sp.]